QLVARVHDHVAVVDRLKQLLYRPEARVVALQVPPQRARTLEHPVVRHLGRGPVGLAHPREAPVAPLPRRRRPARRLPERLAAKPSPEATVRQPPWSSGTSRRSPAGVRSRPCVRATLIELSVGRSHPLPTRTTPSSGI